MTDDSFGKLCALLAAVAWAIAVPLLQRAGKGVHPIASCIVRNSIGVFFLLLSLLAQDIPIRESFNGIGIGTHFWFLASGVIGIALADTLFFVGASHLQVGIIGLTQTIYSPLVLLISAFAFHERLSPHQLFGGGLVVGATLLVKCSVMFGENDSAKNSPFGFLFMIACVICNVISVLLLKSSVEQFPVSLLMPYRNFIGTLPLLLWAGLQSRNSIVRQELRSPAIWKRFILGSFFGGALSSTLWVLGFAYTKASLAALLNESSALFLLLIGYFAYGEKFSGLKLASAFLATVGLCLLWL